MPASMSARAVLIAASIGLGLASAAQTAPAQTGTAQTATAQTAPEPATAVAQGAGPAQAGKPASERRVCRDVGETGTRLVKRMCRTRAEWSQIDVEEGRRTAQWRDQASRRNAGGN